MRMPAGLTARLLLAAVLLTPPLAFSAQGISDLDVTIRMIERQDPRIDNIINRIDPPAARIAMPPDRGNRADSERSRDRNSRPGERRQQANEIAGTARDARERRREAQEEARRDAREDSRDGQRRFRDD